MRELWNRGPRHPWLFLAISVALAFAVRALIEYN